MKKIISIIAYLIFLITVIVCSLELLLRVDIIQPAFIMGQWKIVLNERSLYKLKPNQGHGINSKGFRTPEFDIKKSHKKRILYMGDSFAMGVNVSEDKTAPAVLNELLGEEYEVINFGVIGYGPDQEYIQLIDEGLKLNPDYVVLSLYPSNDMNDIIRNQLISISEDGKLEWNDRNVVVQNLPRLKTEYLYDYFIYLKSLDQKSYKTLFETLFRDGFDLSLLVDDNSNLTRYKIALFQKVLKSISEVLENEHIPLIVAVIPSFEGVTEFKGLQEVGVSEQKYFAPTLITEQLLSKMNVASVRVLDFFRNHPRKNELFDMDDHHLSAFGYAELADRIRLILKMLELTNSEKN